MDIPDSVIWLGIVRVNSKTKSFRIYPNKKAKRRAKKLRRIARKFECFETNLNSKGNIMKVLQSLVDIHTGEVIHQSSVEVDSQKYYEGTLAEEVCFMGEMVHAHYSEDDSIVGPEQDFDQFFGISPEDFIH